MHVWWDFLVLYSIVMYRFQEDFCLFIVKDVIFDFDCCINFFRCFAHFSYVLFFMGSTRIKFPSVSHNTMINLFPWLDTTGNFPFWSVYFICFMSSVLVLISLILVCGMWTTCDACHFLIILLIVSSVYFASCALFIFLLPLGNTSRLLLLLTLAIWHETLLKLLWAIFLLSRILLMHGSTVIFVVCLAAHLHTLSLHVDCLCTLLELWSLPKDMMGVMLQWAVFVESANKPVFVNLQQRVIHGISSHLKSLKTHLVR